MQTLASGWRTTLRTFSFPGPMLVYKAPLRSYVAMTTTSSQDPRCQQFHQLSGESAVVSAAVVTGRRAPPFSVILCPEKEMFSGTKNVSLVRGLALPCCERCMAQFYQGLPRAWPFPVAEFVG